MQRGFVCSNGVLARTRAHLQVGGISRPQVTQDEYGKSQRRGIARSRLSWQRLNHSSDVSQVVVELMIAARHAAKMGLWNRVCIQFNV
jgi:hypothetical protein